MLLNPRFKAKALLRYARKIERHLPTLLSSPVMLTSRRVRLSLPRYTYDPFIDNLFQNYDSNRPSRQHERELPALSFNVRFGWLDGIRMQI